MLKVKEALWRSLPEKKSVLEIQSFSTYIRFLGNYLKRERERERVTINIFKKLKRRLDVCTGPLCTGNKILFHKTKKKKKYFSPFAHYVWVEISILLCIWNVCGIANDDDAAAAASATATISTADDNNNEKKKKKKDFKVFFIVHTRMSQNWKKEKKK